MLFYVNQVFVTLNLQSDLKTIQYKIGGCNLNLIKVIFNLPHKLRVNVSRLLSSKYKSSEISMLNNSTTPIAPIPFLSLSVAYVRATSLTVILIIRYQTLFGPLTVIELCD